MRIIVGVTGATGVEMSYYLMQALKSVEGCKIHLVLSSGAKALQYEDTCGNCSWLCGYADYPCSRCLLERGAQSYIGSEGNAAEPHSAKEYERSGGCRMHNCSPGADFL